MKKLLLSLSLMALACTNIKAADHSTINETTASEQIEFTKNNDPLILENSFSKQPVKDKAFLDLSIREVWNTKLKPFLTSTKGLTLLLSSFSILQISRLFNISQKMKYDNSFFSRYALFRSFDLNAALLALPHAILIATIIAGIIDDLLPRVK